MMNQPYLESQDNIEDEWYIEDQWLSENEWQSPLRETDVSGREQENTATERPTKIRKQDHPPTATSQTARKAKHHEAVLDAECFVSIYGFSPSEFLPLFPTSERTLDPRLCLTLCDDSLGKCLFGGYLTTVDTVRLATVSKKFQDLARDSVQRLDLSRLPNLTPLEVRNIVARYPALTVRSGWAHGALHDMIHTFPILSSFPSYRILILIIVPNLEMNICKSWLHLRPLSNCLFEAPASQVTLFQPCCGHSLPRIKAAMVLLSLS